MLPALDPGEAYLRQTVPAALTGRMVGGLPMRADLPRLGPGRLGWFGCAGGWAFAPERLDGEAVAVAAGDGPGAAALLERLELLLRQIELGLGIELEPDAVVEAPPADALIVRVVTRDAARLWLAVPRDAALLPASPELAPVLLAAVPVPVTLAIQGPRVPPLDAAALAPGDLILLGAGPLAATLTAGTAPATAGRFDPATGAFHPS